MNFPHSYKKGDIVRIRKCVGKNLDTYYEYGIVYEVMKNTIKVIEILDTSKLIVISEKVIGALEYCNEHEENVEYKLCYIISRYIKKMDLITFLNLFDVAKSVMRNDIINIGVGENIIIKEVIDAVHDYLGEKAYNYMNWIV
ncbi:MAG: hypothetical protein ACK5HP_04610 [Bacilli bacterium]